MSKRSSRLSAALIAVALALMAPAASLANTSHAGWPPITGMVLINLLDQPRPLDGRPGGDPFDGSFASKVCRPPSHSECVPDGTLLPVVPGVGVTCSALVAAESALSAQLNTPTPASVCSAPLAKAALIPATIGHNELLGGGGSDTIHAGPAGDVIWGDYKPNAQPTTQFDRLYGGPGNDFIYTSHGTNFVSTGGGTDVVHAHFGHGQIRCDSPTVTVFLSRVSRPGWKLPGCKHISYKPAG
ncbi:MAG TPA: hypothetical protein VHW26_10260 [Solirubrobacteraceae bacterium]|jgi:hypothetical protein|nr:hypothetical protein [Solirubrobacteraceae bacterium]